MSETPEPDATEPEPSAVREWLSLIGGWAVLALVVAACVSVPVAVSVWVSPWLGPPLAVGSFWVWAKLGPRPFPGLIPGCLFLGGFAVIAGTFLGCAALAVRSLWAEPGAAPDTASIPDSRP